MKTGRMVISWLVVVSLLGALIVSAVLADGRTGSASQTHDGGAWLLNRSTSSIGHVNRVVGEIESTAGPFSGAFDVHQARNVVVVENRGSGEAVLIDTNLSLPGAPLQLSPDMSVRAVPDGVVLFESSTGRTWKVSRDEFGMVPTLEDEAPVVQADPQARIAVGPDGRIIVAEPDGSVVHDVDPSGVVEQHEIFDTTPADGSSANVDPVDPVVAATLVGDVPVLLHDSGRVIIVADELLEVRIADAVTLQQPSAQGTAVIVVRADGSMVTIDLRSGDRLELDGMTSASSIAPIAHRDCVWSVSTEPVVFHFCGQSRPLPNAGPNVKLTLVNDWVWVNDVDQGGIWFVQEDDLEVREISDWSAALLLNDQTETDESIAGGDEDIVTSADADELGDLDQLDDDDRNEPPVAEDDAVATRQGRPIVIDVLANDFDPDNDPLSIDELTNVDADGRVAAGAQVSITADDGRIQVVPPVDFVGDISFGYVVHDGRQGRDDARVTLTVVAPDESTNRPPVTVIDNATVRAGKSVVLNVLANDADPDGDVLVLIEADDIGGAVNFTPGGELTFTPDVTSPDGTVDIGYRVADDFGAEASGTARIRVRSADSNQEPVARNDVGHTTVGRSVVLNVLANDIDPDGDPLIAQNLQSEVGSVTGAQLSPDGFFLFRPEAAGTFRFTYAVSDGPTVGQAQIRITVDPPVDNRPPVAVLDTIALAVGESRLVRVLDNDGDPDGDVVGIVDWVGAEGLEITEVPGVGFNVKPTPSAAPRTEFRYWISDGIAEPVRGDVIVAALVRDPVDYPPVATIDIVDVRAGSTAELFVLRNDYDPEGRSLSIVSPIAQPPEALVRVSPSRQSLLLTVDDDQQFGFQFSYDVADPAGNRGSAIVQVRIVPPTQPNRAPVAGPDVATTVEATPTVIAVLTNDFDPDGDPINVESIAQQPEHGSVEVRGDGTILYRPDPRFTGTDRFTYTLVDGYQAPLDTTIPIDQRGPGRSLGEVLIGVMPEASANRPPRAVDDGGFVPVRIAGDPVDLDVLANDSDPDQDRIVVTAVTVPAVGTAIVADDGLSVVFRPPVDGDPRAVSFSYTISDGRGGTAFAQVTVDLAEQPDPIPPIAVDDTVGPVTARSTVSLDPRTNDIDPDGDSGRLTVLSDDPAVAVLDDGTVELTAPNATTEIEYRVQDDQGLVSEPAFVTVLIAENQAPIVSPLAVETPFNQPVVVDVGEAVVDPDDDPLVITLGQQRQGGSARVVGSAETSGLEVEFTPDTDFEGAARFDYVVDDRNGHTVTGSVDVTVLPPENREPVAAPSQVTAEAGVATVVRLSDLVTDPDGPDGHSYSVNSSSGPVEVGAPNANGEVTITSAVTSGGSTASFSYTVVDGPYNVSNTVAVDLIVARFPAPSLAGDSTRTLQAQATTPIRVLENDVDNSPAGLAGGGLVITEVGVSPAGTTALVGDSIVFTPRADFFGTTTFTYTVQDGRRAVEGQSSATVTVDVVGRPAPPQPPSVDSVGSQYLVVRWAAPQGDAARAPVSGYILEYTAGDGTTGRQVFDTPTTSYRWDGLTNAVEYCFRVAAVNEAGEGEFSAAAGGASCGTPDVRPEAPSAPVVEFADSQLRLSWPTPLNQGSAINNYQVRISGGLQDISAELGVTNSHVWTNLENGTDYTFEVRARNNSVDNDGWSDWSSLSSPEHPLTVPDAPTQPGAERGDRQVRVTWQAPYDGGDQISAYQVRSSISPTWVTVTPQGQSNSHVWENIPNGTDVSFAVRAVNRDPASTTPGNISPDSPVVRACSVPDAVAKPGVVRGDTQVVVSWTPPNDQGCAISEYRITSSAGVQTASATETSRAFTGLTNGTSYTFTVTAINEVVTVDGRAAQPSPASDPVTPAGPPFVSNVTGATNIAPRQVRVSWSAANPNGSPVVMYQLSVNDGAWFDVGNVTTVTRTEASNGATYTYRVRAVNSVGPSTQIGAAASATTWTYPGTPTVSASPGNGSATSSWTNPSTGGTSLTGHEAKIITSGCGGGGTVRTNPNSPETWTGLANGTTYRICVRYSNAVGWGPWGSATATPQAPAPSVNAFWGGSAQGRPGCSAASCKYLHGTGSNFPPGLTVSVACQSNESGSWVQFGSTYSRVVDGSGTVSFGNTCYYGFTGSQARLVINGFVSNAITN